VCCEGRVLDLLSPSEYELEAVLLNDTAALRKDGDQ
jgi:hypothetical protein